jgi:hypothetical protein
VKEMVRGYARATKINDYFPDCIERLARNQII